jgi:leucine efflux protein
VIALQHLGAFLAASALMIVVPGPATLFVLAQDGTRRAALATLGIVAGDVVLIVLAGAGLASLLARWPGLLRALHLGGALYLAWLGWGLWRSRPQHAAAAGTAGGLARAALTTLTNPKPILFFSGFFPLFIASGDGSALASFLALGALFELLNLAWFAALIVGADRARRLVGGPPSRWPLRRLGGLALMACATAMLVA